MTFIKAKDHHHNGPMDMTCETGEMCIECGAIVGCKVRHEDYHEHLLRSLLWHRHHLYPKDSEDI